jgi:hypothetical protein
MEKDRAMQAGGPGQEMILRFEINRSENKINRFIEQRLILKGLFHCFVITFS